MRVANAPELILTSYAENRPWPYFVFLSAENNGTIGCCNNALRDVQSFNIHSYYKTQVPSMGLAQLSSMRGTNEWDYWAMWRLCRSREMPLTYSSQEALTTCLLSKTARHTSLAASDVEVSFHLHSYRWTQDLLLNPLTPLRWPFRAWILPNLPWISWNLSFRWPCRHHLAQNPLFKKNRSTWVETVGRTIWPMWMEESPLLAQLAPTAVCMQSNFGRLANNKSVGWVLASL